MWCNSVMEEKKPGQKKKKYLFILNPVAGIGQGRDYLRIIQDVCSGRNVRFRILFTRCRGDAAKIIAKRIGKFDVIVAVGGDGTMNEVASSVAGTEAVMALVPAGSGNALGRELGYSMDPAVAVRQVLDGTPVKIDTGLVNGRRFMNVCGVGFDEHISRTFSKAVKRGPLAYFREVLREFFSYRPYLYEVETESSVLKERAFVVTLANTAQYGNNAWIAPGASLTDGELNLCLLKPFGIFGALVLGTRLFAKTIDKSRLCTSFKTRKITIRGENLNFHVDGEPVLNTGPVEISIDPLSLNIIKP